MDTREKIVHLSEAAKRVAEGKWIVVPGLFDPLTPTQAKRIAALRQTETGLAAVVLRAEPTLLSAEARAALIAGLRDVDLVVVADDPEWRRFFPASASVRVVEDPDGEAYRSAEFVQFIIGRQQSA